ncbi:glycosyltransferase WbuB [Desulfococcus multivorans]|uniref:Glycosyl transferase group 1 n=2 Tax=Desulfococcus multivorans TaxID=897 RepID=S7U664_DESML|nr:glycosyltransferase WbuB [Desulfococcus multivorans]EPR44812.1 glycosyl transferase group 1 [Desulfococcus multivorans DSM 2059]SKA29012.1 Glycosyltransferase involved in cell wall bisynthesis [Desulfococcus multivorans DSM 2059]
MSGGTRSYEIARRLVTAGHKVHMITSDRRSKNSGDWYHTAEEGIHVHWLPVPYGNAMPYHKRIKAFLNYAAKAGPYASRFKADVIFATSTPLTIALPAIYASKRLKIPMVFEVRDLWPELPIAVGALKGPLIPPARWLERFAYKNSSEIVALSPGMKEGVVRAGYPSEHVHVIPNSCDVDLFQVPSEVGAAFRKRFPWLDNRPLVIYAGTFGRINGVGYLARLAAETRKLAPEVCFLAVGDGYEFDMVTRLSRELGVLNQNFFVMPQLPKSEMPALFSAATISTSTVIDLPQMWANSANKFFDSLASGRPVAINYAGWQADLIKETGAGLVLPPKDLPGAARLLISALNNKNWLKKAGKAALALARDRFDRDLLAKQLEAVLLKAVHK